MARPKKQAGEKRDEQLKIRLTTAEIEELRTAAFTAGVSVSDYARSRMLGTRLPSKTVSRSDPALVSELNRIGVNVNQLARANHRDSAFVNYWREIGDELQCTLRGLLGGDHGSEDHR